MRIAVLGDLHLGRTIFGHDLTPHIQCCMWRFFDFCVEHRCGVAVQLGDVFDRPSPTEWHRKIVMQWVNEFDRAGITLCMLVGNHDACSSQQAPSALQYIKSNAKTSAWVIDRPTVFPLHGVDLVFAPFPSVGLFSSSQEYFSQLDSVVRRYERDRMIFAHLNVDGAPIGDQEFVYRGADYSIPSQYLYWKVFCGHIHKPQIYRGMDIVGAADRLRFDEVHQCPIMVLIDTAAASVTEAVKRYKRIDAINLTPITLDTRGLTTNHAISELAARPGRDQQNQIIKVTPIVDSQCAVDLHQVQQWLYSDGAEFVHIAPPTRDEQKADPLQLDTTDPTKLARAFIQDRVDGKAERSKVLKRFVSRLREVEEPCL